MSESLKQILGLTGTNSLLEALLPNFLTPEALADLRRQQREPRVGAAYGLPDPQYLPDANTLKDALFNQLDAKTGRDNTAALFAALDQMRNPPPPTPPATQTAVPAQTPTQDAGDQTTQKITPSPPPPSAPVPTRKPAVSNSNVRNTSTQNNFVAEQPTTPEFDWLTFGMNLLANRSPYVTTAVGESFGKTKEAMRTAEADELAKARDARDAENDMFNRLMKEREMEYREAGLPIERAKAQAYIDQIELQKQQASRANQPFSDRLRQIMETATSLGASPEEAQSMATIAFGKEIGLLGGKNTPSLDDLTMQEVQKQIAEERAFRMLAENPELLNPSR